MTNVNYHWTLEGRCLMSYRIQRTLIVLAAVALVVFDGRGPWSP